MIARFDSPTVILTGSGCRRQVVTKFSWRGAADRYADIARVMGIVPTDTSDEAACLALVDALEQMNAELEVPRLRDCCRGELMTFRSTLPKMAADALESGSPQNNPIVPTLAQIVELYEAAW